MKELDLSNIDLGEICLSAAEAQMQNYRMNQRSSSASAFLHVAETNLMSAQRSGKDVTKQYAELEVLKGAV